MSDTSAREACKRTYSKAPFSHFTSAMEVLGTASGQLCNFLGYQTNAYSAWKASGEMPQVAAIACTGLIAAHTPKTSEDLLFIKTKTPDQTAGIRVYTKALGLEVIML